jgi:hypothetical protein
LTSNGGMQKTIRVGIPSARRIVERYIELDVHEP